jgi:hypothetical protein
MSNCTGASAAGSAARIGRDDGQRRVGQVREQRADVAHDLVGNPRIVAEDDQDLGAVRSAADGEDVRPAAGHRRQHELHFVMASSRASASDATSDVRSMGVPGGRSIVMRAAPSSARGRNSPPTNGPVVNR